MELKFIGENKEDLIKQLEDFLGGPTGGTVEVVKGAGKTKTATGGGASKPKITPDKIRELLTPMGSPQDKKDLMAEFSNEEGNPCTSISQLQEADYPAIVARIAERTGELELLK